MASTASESSGQNFKRAAIQREGAAILPRANTLPRTHASVFVHSSVSRAIEPSSSFCLFE